MQSTKIEPQAKKTNWSGQVNRGTENKILRNKTEFKYYNQAIYKVRVL